LIGTLNQLSNLLVICATSQVSVWKGYRLQAYCGDRQVRVAKYSKEPGSMEAKTGEV